MLFVCTKSLALSETRDFTGENCEELFSKNQILPQRSRCIQIEIGLGPFRTQNSSLMIIVEIINGQQKGFKIILSQANSILLVQIYYILDIVVKLLVFLELSD